MKLFPAISVVMNGKDGHRLKFEKESPTVIIMFSAPWWKGIVNTGNKKHLKPRIDLKQHFSLEGKTKSVP